MKKVILTAVCMLFAASTAFASDDSFTLTNQTAGKICFAYASVVNEKSYGEDILGMEDCLAPSESAVLTFDTKAKNPWDLLIKDDMGKETLYTNINFQGIETVTLMNDGKLMTK